MNRSIIHKIKALFTLFVFVLIFGISTNANSAEVPGKITLKVVSALPLGMPIFDTLKYFAEKVESVSQGNIEVKLFRPDEVIPAMEIHDVVSKGIVNAGFTGSIYLCDKIPAGQFFTAIPFGPSVTGYMTWYYTGNGMNLYQEMYDNNSFNIKAFPLAFACMETGGWFRKPINSPDDFKGLKLRWPGLGKEILARLGASAALISGAEILPAFKKGAIDGAEVSLPIIDKMLGFPETGLYNYFPGWHQPSSNFELIINKTVWNSMSPFQQELIELAVKASNAHSIAVSDGIQGRVLKENMEKYGVKNMIYPASVLKALNNAWLDVASEISARDPFFNKVWKDIQEFMSEHNLWECYTIHAMPHPDCK